MLLLDLFYLLTMAILSPWLLWRAAATGRYRRDLAAKFLGRGAFSGPEEKQVAWFHAVSVGEVNLLGTLVPAFRKRHPEWLVVVSSTTDTGLAEARRRFTDLPVMAWPLDFSWAVSAALRRVRPRLVVLTESEMWPNFLRAARREAIPVIVVNARMSPRSFQRLRRFAGFARKLLFDRVTRIAVQEPEYAERFRQLGVPVAKLVTTGSVKYDGASGLCLPSQSDSLRRLLGIKEQETGDREEKTGNRRQGTGDTLLPVPCPLSPIPYSLTPAIWLAGSTHAPEESIVLGVFARIFERFPQLRLILVPRHPDRFEEVARLVEQTRLPFVRRSRITEPLAALPAIVLLDTIGELGAAWSLADVGFTGGSLDGHRGGQSMIEPAGYGVPCLFGPHVWNFKDAARRLVEIGGAIMVNDAGELERELTKLLADVGLRERMGAAARDLVHRQQGATGRTLQVIDDVLGNQEFARQAA
ncbi:MAG TPA: 3-deoxy-D-manno-octulosonic acid transferase [Urbifossiella sp.]